MIATQEQISLLEALISQFELDDEQSRIAWEICIQQLDRLDISQNPNYRAYEQALGFLQDGNEAEFRAQLTTVYYKNSESITAHLLRGERIPDGYLGCEFDINQLGIKSLDSIIIDENPNNAVYFVDFVTISPSQGEQPQAQHLIDIINQARELCQDQGKAAKFLIPMSSNAHWTLAIVDIDNTGQITALEAYDPKANPHGIYLCQEMLRQASPSIGANEIEVNITTGVQGADGTRCMDYTAAYAHHLLPESSPQRNDLLAAAHDRTPVEVRNAVVNTIYEQVRDDIPEDRRQYLEEQLSDQAPSPAGEPSATPQANGGNTPARPASKPMLSKAALEQLVAPHVAPTARNNDTSNDNKTRQACIQLFKEVNKQADALSDVLSGKSNSKYDPLSRIELQLYIDRELAKTIQNDINQKTPHKSTDALERTLKRIENNTHLNLHTIFAKPNKPSSPPTPPETPPTTPRA